MQIDELTKGPLGGRNTGEVLGIRTLQLFARAIRGTEEKLVILVTCWETVPVLQTDDDTQRSPHLNP